MAAAIDRKIFFREDLCLQVGLPCLLGMDVLRYPVFTFQVIGYTFLEACTSCLFICFVLSCLWQISKPKLTALPG
jgi:hypothetical protein